MKLLSIPVGVSDFEEIRRNGYYYVDKSGSEKSLTEKQLSLALGGSVKHLA